MFTEYLPVECTIWPSNFCIDDIVLGYSVNIEYIGYIPTLSVHASCIDDSGSHIEVDPRISHGCANVRSARAVDHTLVWCHPRFSTIPYHAR
jgi:hypothetical protein